jgi:hypothetical protein
LVEYFDTEFGYVAYSRMQCNFFIFKINVSENNIISVKASKVIGYLVWTFNYQIFETSELSKLGLFDPFVEIIKDK